MTNFYCPICKLTKSLKTTHSKRKYCSNECRAKAREGVPNLAVSKALKGRPKPDGFGEKISKALTGKPKPWHRGKNNPNYGNKAQKPYRDKFLKSVKLRGQVWTEEHRNQHSARMSGETNWMRGKRHKRSTKKKLSDAAKKRYSLGLVPFKYVRVSQAEKDLRKYLSKRKIKTVPQYQIPGVPYFYDLYLPEYHTIIEYHCDYYHCNPKKYYANVPVKFPGGKVVLPRTIWKRDRNKESAARERGYNVVVLWENDYKRLGIEQSVLTILSSITKVNHKSTST